MDVFHYVGTDITLNYPASDFWFLQVKPCFVWHRDLHFKHGSAWRTGCLLLSRLNLSPSSTTLCLTRNNILPIKNLKTSHAPFNQLRCLLLTTAIAQSAPCCCCCCGADEQLGGDAAISLGGERCSCQSHGKQR